MSLLSYSITWFRVFGLWFSDEHTSRWKATLYLFYNVLVVFWIYSLTVSQLVALYSCMDDASEFTDASFITLTMIAVCAKIYNMIGNRKVITRMIKTLESGTFEPRDSVEREIQADFYRKIK